MFAVSFPLSLLFQSQSDSLLANRIQPSKSKRACCCSKRPHPAPACRPGAGEPSTGCRSTALSPRQSERQKPSKGIIYPAKAVIFPSLSFLNYGAYAIFNLKLQVAGKVRLAWRLQAAFCCVPVFLQSTSCVSDFECHPWWHLSVITAAFFAWKKSHRWN